VAVPRQHFHRPVLVGSVIRSGSMGPLGIHEERHFLLLHKPTFHFGGDTRYAS